MINASLPAWGNWYIARGQNSEKNNELIKARDSYLQASKFVRSADAQAKLTLGLGKINERLGRFDKAEQEYEKALIYIDTKINQGILAWFKVKWPRQPGLTAFSPASASGTPSGIAPQLAAPIPQGSSDPVQFARENEENLFSALSNNNEAVAYLQALREQHGDRQNIAAQIDDLETRALCLRDSAALVTIALGLQQFSQEQSSGVYNCVAAANPSRYVVSPEDTLIIQTVRDALPITKETLYYAYRNLIEGYQP